MSACNEATIAPRVVENTFAPRYFVTDIGPIERYGSDCVEIAACIRHGTHLLWPEYTVVIPLDCLPKMTQVIERFLAALLVSERDGCASH